MFSLLDPTISNPVLSVLKIEPSDRVISVTENLHADSNFIITHLIKKILHENSNFCFLTLHNELDHYQNVGRKLGYDLQKAIDNGKAMVIDSISDIAESIGENELFFQGQELLKSLLSKVKENIEKFSKTKTPNYLIIDDLSHFLDLGIHLSDIVSFINYCVNIDKDVAIILGTNVSSKKDQIIANSLEYIADVCIGVSALTTGRSNEVTGVISVQRGDNKNLYHYRSFDRGVKTFHPGESIYHMYK